MFVLLLQKNIKCVGTYHSFFLYPLYSSTPLYQLFAYLLIFAYSNSHIYSFNLLGIVKESFTSSIGMFAVPVTFIDFFAPSYISSTAISSTSIVLVSVTTLYSVRTRLLFSLVTFNNISHIFLYLFEVKDL